MPTTEQIRGYKRKYAQKPETIAKRRAYYQKIKATRLAYNRQWRKDHPEQNKATYQAWYARPENKERVRGYRKKSKLRRRASRYGMTVGQFNALLEAQGNTCVICGANHGTNLVVDHDHKTGAIRGLLCNACNRALGLLKDSPEVAARAVEYLLAQRERMEAKWMTPWNGISKHR